MNLNEQDIKKLSQKKIDIQDIKNQYHTIKNGNQYLQILRPAKINDGIIKLDTKEKEKFSKIFDENKTQYNLQKFVPASGAATRMFKEWIYFHNQFNPKKDFYKRFIKKHQLTTFEPETEDFLDNLSAYPFYEKLMQILLKKEPGFHQLPDDEQIWKAIHYILTDEGLNYQNLPKALLLFHRYNKNDIKTAFEEHLIEAENYAHGKNTIPLLELSISPAHHEFFSQLKTKLEEHYQVQVNFSFQKPSTDTIMLDENNNLVRDDKGQIIFRPGGHGSLIENLQDLKSEIIFIKNIDNVQKGDKKNDTLSYKKILGGILIDLLKKNKKYLKQLRDEKPIHEKLKEIEDFAQNQMNIKFIEGYDALDNSGKRKYLFYKLNRPIRVAGVVKNTGEPGGGPFWTLDQNQMETLQIVEKAQVDLNNSEQKEIWEASTHFNPVDLVISIQDFEGNIFNLKDFVNKNTGFITEKSFNGKPVKVYEHPGLWNGAMDLWNTIFVEVPLSTFTPVKTVKDLLKEAHL